MKGAAYIADFLVQQRVPYIFGLCGHGILGLLDGLYDRRHEIATISVHHEAVAGFMADAYFRVTQRPVATYTSCGPGSANLVVAVGGGIRGLLRDAHDHRQRPQGSGIAAPSRRPDGTSRATSSTCCGPT